MKSVPRLPIPDAPPCAKNVLVVDPRETILTVLGGLLRSWGFRPYVATNLLEACRTVIAEGPFDAVICNYDLPEGNAFDLFAWMERQGLEVMTIVPCDNKPPTTVVPHRVKLLVKPFDPVELHESLATANSHVAAPIRRSALRRGAATAVRR